MDPLTIVHVSTQRLWHGGEEQARLLIEGLRNRGHRNVVLARRGGKFAERMAGAGVEVLTTAGSGRGPLSLIKSRGLLRRLRPHVIHFHDPHALSGAGLAAWGLPISARIAARRVDFPIRSPQRYCRLSDCVIAVSHAVKDVCVASGLAPDLIRVVHDGVDPARGRSGDRQRGRAALGLNNEALLLLTVATLTDHKGHTFLLQAMPAILAQFPHAQLVLAGDGELRETLEAQARELSLGDRVRFLGFRPDVPDLLNAADLFIMPSHMEGLCSSLLDVMFARTPIVATTAGGIPEILGRASQGETPVAWLVPPRDPDALAQAVIAALTNNLRRCELVDLAAARAGSFTADAMVDGTLAVYRELVLRSRAAGG